MTTDSRQPFYEHIGRLVVRFNDLETLVALLIAGVIKEQPDVAMAMTADMRLLSRLDLLKAIAPFTIKDPRLCVQMDTLLEEMTVCNTDRNKIVHSTWMDGVEGIVRRYKPSIKNRKGLKAGLLATSTDEIEATIGKVNGAISRLSDFIGVLEDRGIMRFHLVKLKSASPTTPPTGVQ